jgi:hypothetical protein
MMNDGLIAPTLGGKLSRRTMDGGPPDMDDVPTLDPQDNGRRGSCLGELVPFGRAKSAGQGGFNEQRSSFSDRSRVGSYSELRSSFASDRTRNSRASRTSFAREDREDASQPIEASAESKAAKKQRAKTFVSTFALNDDVKAGVRCECVMARFYH